ncbi:hypothetical protein JQK87_28435 [Streptomyces sp. G44]|uniref:HAAS signaling domain-containing protein n=1 Tax=Streptomyces sp. G44 TaxID=2807632 RepID=UPI001960E914|nr:hypothetical protein [Streptomyces sp. G44]MBM7172251.1 hypothetical protein [Streptomyces sp. G44]
MGIESDQLVYDYLSRVGDLAQQRQLPSGARMRLVADLRDRIDRSRADATDTPAAVRRILAGLGTPEEIVDGADGAPADVREHKTRPSVPAQRAERPREPKGREGWRLVPRPRRGTKEVPRDLVEGPRPSPPHLAGADELGPGGSEPDWWRLDSSPFGGADTVPGFVGGVEIPEILKPPPSPDDATPAGDIPGGETPEAEVEFVEDTGKRWRRLPRLPVRGDGTGFSNPLLLLAAVLLLVGAVLGSLPALGGGWLIAYLSRRLTRAEAKWAVFGMPGLAVAAGLTWLWGRSEGRWGEPIRDGHMGDAIGEAWPWVLRGAAVASALFLVWRSQRRRP